MDRPSRIGFVDGALAPWRGLGFILVTPATWIWAAVPVVVCLVLIGALGVGGVAAIEHVMSRWLAEATNDWQVAFGWVVRVVLWLTASLLAIVIGFSLAQPLSSGALERLVCMQEEALGRGRAHGSEAFHRGIWRAIRVSLASIAATLVVLIALAIVDVAFPPATIVTVPLKFVATALILSFDVLDYPLDLRRVGVRRRAAWIREHFAASLGFGLSLALVFMIPCAGLLLLPAGVVGATLLVVKSEDEPRRSPFTPSFRRP